MLEVWKEWCKKARSVMNQKDRTYRTGEFSNPETTPLTVIVFDDSASLVGWMPKEQVQEKAQSAMCVATGFVAREDKRSVTLMQARSTTGGSGLMFSALTIPKGAIVAREEVESHLAEAYPYEE